MGKRRRKTRGNSFTYMRVDYSPYIRRHRTTFRCTVDTGDRTVLFITTCVRAFVCPRSLPLPLLQKAMLEEKAQRLKGRARIHRHNRMVLTARKDSGRLLQGAQEQWDARGRSIYGDAWDDPQDGNLPLRFAASACMRVYVAFLTVESPRRFRYDASLGAYSSVWEHLTWR